MIKERKHTEASIQKLISRHIGSNCKYKFGNFYLFGVSIESDFIVVKESGYVYEYEIKISRGDFFADLKKEKRHKVLQDVTETFKPNKFYYVVPEGLITPEEIPDYCGLIYVEKSNRLYEIVRAPILHRKKNDLDKHLCYKFYFRWKNAEVDKLYLQSKINNNELLF